MKTNTSNSLNLNLVEEQVNKPIHNNYEENQNPVNMVFESSSLYGNDKNSSLLPLFESTENPIYKVIKYTDGKRIEIPYNSERINNSLKMYKLNKTT